MNEPAPTESRTVGDLSVTPGWASGFSLTKTMKIIKNYKDSVGVDMQEIAPTTEVQPSSSVWLLFERGYGEDGYAVAGAYSSEEAANQAMAFALNPAPNHVSAYVEKVEVRTLHTGGLFRVWPNDPDETRA